MIVIDKVAPRRNKKVKEKLKMVWHRSFRKTKWQRLVRKFEKSRLNIDEELYKKNKYDWKLITSKKQAFFEEKISETTGELKKLRQPRKSLGISNKTNF